MPRVRVSTTVDSELVTQVRQLDPGATDASLVDRAFRAFLAQHRRAEIDESYDLAYAEHPLEEPDAWGDLAGFHEAVSRS